MAYEGCMLAAYAGSKNYRSLLDLARKQSVICIVDSELGKADTIRDVARTIYTFKQGAETEEIFTVSARGVCYIYAFGEDDFVQWCEKLNLEYIAPPQTASTTTVTE